MAAVAPASAPAGFASGHYHFSVQGIGRGNGAPIIAKAAYRSGECLYDERIGQMFDYRGGAERVIDSFVMARDEVPAWMQHAAREARQRAWNEAERAEPRANGRIATELVVGLPHELTDAQRKQMLSGFVRRIVEKHGVFADVSIHTAHDERNIHAHVLLSHRELGPDGFGEIANRRTITKKVKGQEKQIGIAGIAATPGDIKRLREQWAKDVNRAYEKAGLDIRVDHRSFDDRGLKETPTIHLGPTASKMEREGQRSDRGDINRMIEVGNDEVRRLAGEKARQDGQIIDLAAKLAERQAHEAAKGRLDDIQSDFGEPQSSPPARRGRKQRQPEHDDMDEDIAAKQREQRQQIEDREAATFNDMVADKNRADRNLQEWQIQHDHGARNKKFLQEQLLRREAEDGITDVRVRAMLAAGESRDFVQAVRVEGAMITREHLDLQREIALEQDPDKKQMLEFRRDIQHADYMALANERVAAMSNLNSEQHKDAQRQQEEWARTGTELRRERLELQDRMADRNAADISAVERMNRADRQREEYRSDIRGPASGMTAEQVEEMAARFGEDHQPTAEERAQQEAYAGARGRRDNIGPLPETRDEMEEHHQGRPDPYSDQAASRAYDQQVAQAGEQPTAEGRTAFIQDWRQAQEEDRQAAIEAAYERGDLGDRWAAVQQDNQPTPEARRQQERDAAVSDILSSDMPALRAAEAIEAVDRPAQASAPGQPERPVSEAELPAEIILAAPTRPENEPAAESTRETTDARQVESSTAEHEEITDAKAAKLGEAAHAS